MKITDVLDTAELQDDAYIYVAQKVLQEDGTYKEAFRKIPLELFRRYFALNKSLCARDFIAKYVDDDGNAHGATISPGDNITHPDGDKAAIVILDGVSNSAPVVLRHLADGIESTDAATVGQVKAVDMTTEKDLTYEQKAQARKNIGAAEDTASLFIREERLDGKECAEVSVSATGVTTEDGTDVLSGIVLFYEHHYDGSCILRNISDGEYDHDAATVGQLNAAVGDIETAIDSIIAIQDSLIGGAV